MTNKIDKIAMHGEALGSEKTRAEAIAKELRGAFDGMHAARQSLAERGILVQTIVFDEAFLEAAWRAFDPLRAKGPPMMPTEEEIILGLEN